MLINGVVAGETLYHRSHRVGIDYPTKAYAEDYYTKYGWWFPSDDVYIINEVLDHKRMGLKHLDIEYRGTLLTHDNKLIDIRLAGDNRIIMSPVSEHALMAVLAGDDEASKLAMIATAISEPEYAALLDVPVTTQYVLDKLDTYSHHGYWVEVKRADILEELKKRFPVGVHPSIAKDSVRFNKDMDAV